MQLIDIKTIHNNHEPKTDKHLTNEKFNASTNERFVNNDLKVNEYPQNFQLVIQSSYPMFIIFENLYTKKNRKNATFGSKNYKKILNLVFLTVINEGFTFVDNIIKFILVTCKTNINCLYNINNSVFFFYYSLE